MVKAPKVGIRPEVEIAVIIKKKIKGGFQHRSRYILGYTVFNDIIAPALAKEDAYYAYRRDPLTGDVK